MLGEKKTGSVRSNESALVRTGYPQALDYVDAYAPGYGEDEGNTGNIHRRLRAILKHKWLILGLTVLATVVAVVRMYQVKTTYRSSSVIEVGKEDTSVVKYGDLLIQNDETLKTKVFLLTSTPLLEDVAEHLGLDKNQDFRRDLILTGQSREYTKRSISEAVRDIGVRVHLKSSPVRPTVMPSLIAGENPLPKSAARSQELKPIVEALRAHLTVDIVPDTRLLKVTFVHTDPVITAFVANGIAQRFIDTNFEGKSEKFNKTSDWQEKTTRELRDRVTAAEEAFAKYGRDHKIFFAGEKKEPLAAEGVGRLDAELTRASTDRMVKESLYTEVKEGRTNQIPQSFTDPQTVELQKKLGELAVKAAEMEVNYGPENPQVIELREQVAAIRKQIEGNREVIEAKIKADYMRAVRDEETLKRALAQAKNAASNENQEAIQYNILQQEVETAKSFYRDFLQKTSQSDFQLSQQSNNLRLVEPADVPKSIDGPARLQWIALTLILSLGVGICLALLLDYFDNTIKNVDDVSRCLQLPVMGIIPSVRTNARRLLGFRGGDLNLNGTELAFDAPGALFQSKWGDLVEMEDSSSVAEAYRGLRTSIILSDTAASTKTLLFTSSEPSEGKTTTCINAAISMAKLGQSVLVIDCDLRNPSVSGEFGIGNAEGIASYLASQVNHNGHRANGNGNGNGQGNGHHLLDEPEAAKIERLIQPSGIPNLSIIPCGAPPANPAELISSKKMRDMLGILSGSYDHILIDSPPLINLTDALILSELSDAVMLVVRSGKSDRTVVRRSCLRLWSVGANILGIVLNRAQ